MYISSCNNYFIFLVLVLYLLTICIDAEKPIQGASIKICISICKYYSPPSPSPPRDKVARQQFNFRFWSIDRNKLIYLVSMWYILQQLFTSVSVSSC